MNICGSWTDGKKKPCKQCKYALRWGIGTMYCFKHSTDVSYGNHCKYYKRDSYLFTKDGKCKIDEALLYM